MTQPAPVRRSSPGGHVVSDSLALAGFAPRPDVALVETVRPGAHPHAHVVCQNAWNFLSRGQYSLLVRDYTPRRRALYTARRAVADINTRRAGANVVLSAYMRDLLIARGRRTLLAPVTLPWDLCASEDGGAAGAGPFPGLTAPGSSAPDRPFVLVPGTLTWYKNPAHALDLVARLPVADRPLVVFAGTDDDSGCAAHVRARAIHDGTPTWIGPVDRRSMKWLLARAELTLIPSRLESLSLSLSEALLLSRRVAATPIAVHREVATRMSREPVWLTDDRAGTDLAQILGAPDGPDPPDLLGLAGYRDEWIELARTLNATPGRDA